MNQDNLLFVQRLTINWTSIVAFKEYGRLVSSFCNK
jgi:hypothetical protein